MKNSNIGILGKEKKWFLLILVEVFFVFIFIFFAIFFLLKQNAEFRRLTDAGKNRYESYLLADQLRQSSDDLTRMVRTYAATKNVKFEQLFWDILDIRNGEKEQPIFYERVYWDFITVDNPVPPYKNGKKVALEYLMRQAGFTQKEFDLLAVAKLRSDKLVNFENTAMNLMKEVVSDDGESLPREKRLAREKAIQILFGKEYHLAKRSIMQPINEFYESIDNRTLLNIQTVEIQVSFYQFMINVFFVLLVLSGFVLILTIYFYTRRMVGNLNTALELKLKEIVERKQVENALKESEEQLQIIFDSAPTIMMLLNENAEVLKMNHSGLTVAGKSAEEVIGLRRGDILNCVGSFQNPQGCGFGEICKTCEARKKVEETFATNQSFHKIEAEFSQKEHGKITKHTILISTIVIKLNAQKMVLVTFDDISGRKKAEEALKDSEEKYRNVVINAIEAICVIQDDMFKYSNPKAVGLFGYTKEELARLKVDETIYPDDKELVISRRLQRERGEQLEGTYYHRILTKDCRIRWVEIKSIIISWDGRPAILVFLADITDRKRAEKELLDAHNELEQRVNKRTEQLEHEIDGRIQVEENLQMAKKEAESANQAKSEFLANISHELRNPMHQILSYSKYGIDKIDKPKEKLLHYFNQTRKSAERLMVLLNDLLDLSKMESGRMDYKLENSNLYQIVSEAVSELTPAIEEKNLAFKVSDPSIPTKVNCDSYKIGQVIRNLLSNAIKFTPEEKCIDIKFERDELINGNNSIPALTISFCDQGVGIPEDELTSVFDKFTQSSKTKTGAGGTGLGLSICQEIIKAHGGKIWVENNLEGGATFSFMLPVEQHTN